MQRAVEARVREQIARHLRVDPRANIGRVVEMQMEQEREKLEKLIDEDHEDPAKAEVLFALMAWLPQLEQQLKRRAR